MAFLTKDKFVAAATREMIGAATQAVGRPIIRAGSADFHFPDDTELIALSFENLTAASVRIVRSSTDADVVVALDGSTAYVTAGLLLSDISRVYLTCGGDAAATGSVTLDLAYLGRRFTSPPMLIAWPAGKGEHQVLAFDSDRTDRRKELVAHLNAHGTYYSQVVYRALDAGTIVAMLAEYTWQGRPLIDQVEPQPLTMAGNYLVFRAPVELEAPSGVSQAGQMKTWGTLLKDRAMTPGRLSADDRLIPLPTAGVFAEAVLGRSNSAEKLDVTRFWNWQDSPIPLAPPDIAPVGTESRATPEDLKPGQLGQPVLNIVNPPTLPSPAGVGAVLGAVASGNMFRDMSGLAGTQGLVQTGMQETLQAATDAGQLASANLRTEAQKAVAMGQIAADVVKSVMGGGGGNSNAAQSLSGAGAMINHGKSMDKAAASSGGGSSSSGPAIRTGSDGATGQTQPNRPWTPGSPGSNEGAVFQRVLHGTLGSSGIDAAKATLAFATPDASAGSSVAIGEDGSGTGGGSVSGGGASGTSTGSVALFPQGYGDSPQPDTKLTQALQTALGALPAADRASLDKMAFTIVNLTVGASAGSPLHRAAGFDQMVEHYSASLLKVAAMYSAFELRKAMRALQAARSITTNAALYAAASAAFDDAIRARVPEIVDGADITDLHVLPKYQSVFALTGGTVDFTPEYTGQMTKMIVNSDNDAAKRCVHGVGYGYLNGALAAAGFFNRGTSIGIWFCGDYSGLSDDERRKLGNPNNWPYVRIPSANDGAVAQAMTTFHMAKLVALMYRGTLVDAASSAEMMALFGNGASWFSGGTDVVPARIWSKGGPFEVLGAKIGRGPLKAGGEVLSEAALVHEAAHDADFAVVWQNMKSPVSQAKMKAVATLIEKTITEFFRP